MKLSTEQQRVLMDLGWKAAKTIHFTGQRALDLGSFADEERIDPQMLLLWSKAMALAAARMEGDAREMGACD